MMLSTKILARVLVVNGSSYVDKFSEKTGGFVIMQHRLRRWWNIPVLWSLCFAILFGRDVASLDLQRSFDLYGLLDDFPPEKAKVVYPGVLPVMTAMLQNAMKSLVRDQPDPNSPHGQNPDASRKSSEHGTRTPLGGNRVRAVSLQNEARSSGKLVYLQ